jgi:branched-chain amino acid transport system permease protein
MEQIFVNILYTTSIYLLVAISFNIIFMSTGYFNLAHAAIIALGSYLSYSLVLFGFTLTFSIIIAIFLSGLIGVLFYIIIYHKLTVQGAKPLFFLIASLGLYIVIQNILSIFFGDDTLSIRPYKTSIVYKFFTIYITNVQLCTICTSFFLFILYVLFLNQTKLGKLTKALSENPNLLGYFGVNVIRIRAYAFFIGSLLAASVGVMSSFETDMRPTMGFSLLLYGIVTIIIGGVGSNKNLIFSALILSSAQHFGSYFIDNRWKEAIAFIILIIFLIWKPLGFSGKKLKKINI